MSKKRWFLLITLLMLAAAVAFVNRGIIATALLPGGMVTMMASDRIGDLGDGMHVAVCGAGGSYAKFAAIGSLRRHHC